MLGGFSQGGATALAAALSYHRRLAGLVCISGWCPDRTRPRAHAANAALPIFFSYGTADPVSILNRNCSHSPSPNRSPSPRP